MTLPKWEALPEPDRPWISPAESSIPASPVFTVQLHPGENIVDLLDMLEDTEFEDVLRRFNENRAAIRLLEQDTRRAKRKLRREVIHGRRHSHDFWDFMSINKFANKNEMVSYEMRFEDKARERIEAVSPKSTPMIITDSCHGLTAKGYQYEKRGRPNKYAVKNEW